MLPMQAGPAQDASESVRYQVGERTLHQLLRSWSRRSSASLCLPTQRAHAAVDSYPATAALTQALHSQIRGLHQPFAPLHWSGQRHLGRVEVFLKPTVASWHQPSEANTTP